MYVIDLLKNTNTTDIIRELSNIPYMFQEIEWDNTISNEQKEILKEKLMGLYSSAIEEMKLITPIKDNSKVLFITSSITGDERLEPILMNLNEKGYIRKCLNNRDDFRNPFSGIIFSDREEVLGYVISNTSLETFGSAKYLATIIKELCFFGIDREDNINYRNEVLDELDNAVKNIDKSECISIDELRETLDIPDNRTKEEKEQEEQQIREKMRICINKYIDFANRVFDEFA